MRKLKLQVQMSIDGYIADLNGEMDWASINWDEKLNQYVKEISEPVDCIVLGRKLAQGFIPYWASNPQGEDPEGVKKLNTTPKVVFTQTLEQTDWPNTTLAKGDLADEINLLKNQPGKDIITYGGAAFVSSLIQNRLIDEYHLFINPAAIGKGLPIFNGLNHKLGLKLKHSTAFSCGIVVLCYEPVHN